MVGAIAGGGIGAILTELRAILGVGWGGGGAIVRGGIHILWGGGGVRSHSRGYGPFWEVRAHSRV